MNKPIDRCSRLNSMLIGPINTQSSVLGDFENNPMCVKARNMVDEELVLFLTYSQFQN